MLLASQHSEIVQYQHCNRELNRGKNVFQAHITSQEGESRREGGAPRPQTSIL
jgi:hypothetical protein